MSEISIRNLLKYYDRLLGLRLIAGERGLDRTINSADTNRPALALSGFVDLFTINLVQLLGNHEIEYLRSLPKERRSQALQVIFQFDIPCMVITGRGRMLPELRELADTYDIPLLKSEFNTPKLVRLLHFYLDANFAPQVTLHGTLVDVHGIGLLFKGRSAIGKSEVALDLVERGHRLVADDTVVITRMAQGILVGHSTEILQDHIEIRGVGILDLQRLFGVRATRQQKRVEVIVHLVDWDEEVGYERIGLDDKIAVILGVELPEITVPLFPGKNITVIIETIAQNYLLRIKGYHSAREFDNRLIRTMQQKASGKGR